MVRACCVCQNIVELSEDKRIFSKLLYILVFDVLGILLCLNLFNQLKRRQKPDLHTLFMNSHIRLSALRLKQWQIMTFLVVVTRRETCFRQFWTSGQPSGTPIRLEARLLVGHNMNQEIGMGLGNRCVRYSSLICIQGVRISYFENWLLVEVRLHT